MRRRLKSLYFFNLDQLPKYSNEHKRRQRLLIITYFFIISVPVIILNDVILAVTGKQAYTFEKYPVVVFWLVCVFALWLIKKKRLLQAKLIVIFFPLLFISSYSLTGYIIGEHFLWQPIVLLGITVIPFMVLDFDEERRWLIISFLVFLTYTLFHNTIMLQGVIGAYGDVFTKLNTTPFIYAAVRVIIFLFLTSIMFYSVRLNDRQNIINEEINASLRHTGHRLETMNAELSAQRNAINNSASLLMTDQHHKIVSVNKNFIRISGFQKDEMEGRQLTELLAVYHDPSFFASMIRTLEAGQVWRGEIKLKSKHGDHFWVQAAFSNIYNSKQDRRGLIAIMFDITKTKEHEARLERLNYEKDRILYAVAHDLKNPLLNFKALLNLIKSGAINESEKEEVFRLMTKECDHSTNLIAELLEIGRLEDENFVLRKSDTNLHEFLNRTLEPFEQSAAQKHINFKKCYDPGIECIPLNENEFVRVIRNLISNAFKFTSENGQISISTEKAPEGKVHILISDNGVGISKDLIPIIFDKFSKASRAGVKGEKSTGLGMWIVKHIVKLHDGEISVTSEEGKGTTFTIELPA